MTARIRRNLLDTTSKWIWTGSLDHHCSLWIEIKIDSMHRHESCMIISRHGACCGSYSAYSFWQESSSSEKLVSMKRRKDQFIASSSLVVLIKQRNYKKCTFPFKGQYWLWVVNTKKSASNVTVMIFENWRSNWMEKVFHIFYSKVPEIDNVSMTESFRERE